MFRSPLPVRRVPTPRFFTLILVLLSASLAVTTSVTAAVQYIYDENGRVVGVVDPAGAGAQYNYDALGNTTSIKRVAAGTLALLEFSPNAGPIGSTVTIQGNGFSTTASSNTVKFNGVTANVSSASANKLIVTVPAGATTGALSVTVGTLTATSASSFTVNTAVTAPPTITGFSPNVGAAGTAVTISGTNFVSPASDNNVKFNFSPTTGIASTATSVNTFVPTYATSGKIAVSTPNGTAMSAADFFVPPTGYVATDVAVTARLSNPGSANVAISSSGKVALAVFDAAAGSRAAIRITNSTIASGVMRVFYPDGSAMPTAAFSTSGGYWPTVTFNVTGTYLIVVDPDANNTGSVTLNIGEPDISVSNLIIGTVTVNQDGSYSIPVTFQVTNAGSLSAIGGWFDHTYLSTDGTFDTSDLNVGYVERATDLAPGASYTVNMTAVTSASTPAGSHTLFVKADLYATPTDGGRLAEANETNNTLSVSMNLPGKPDLVISNLTVGTVTVNQNGSYNIPVSFQVTNGGATTAKANWYDNAYLSTDGTFDTSDLNAGYVERTTDLAPGASYTVNMTAVTSASTSAGSHTLFVKADLYATPTDGGRLAEANENNNTLSKVITLPTK